MFAFLKNISKFPQKQRSHRRREGCPWKNMHEWASGANVPSAQARGLESSHCPLCNKHCPLSSPGCDKGVVHGNSIIQQSMATQQRAKYPLTGATKGKSIALAAIEQGECERTDHLFAALSVSEHKQQTRLAQEGLFLLERHEVGFDGPDSRVHHPSHGQHAHKRGGRCRAHRGRKKM